MKEIMLAVAIAMAAMVLGGCESMPAAIEQGIGQYGEGEWEEQTIVRKNGTVMFDHTIKIRCDRGADGKLAGCHKL